MRKEMHLLDLKGTQSAFWWENTGCEHNFVYKKKTQCTLKARVELLMPDKLVFFSWSPLYCDTHCDTAVVSLKGTSTLCFFCLSY